MLLLPDLYFGEAYTNGSLVIENGSLTEFLDIAIVYALINFIGTVAVLKLFSTGSLGREK